jgi:hypothetical protein
MTCTSAVEEGCPRCRWASTACLIIMTRPSEAIICSERLVGDTATIVETRYVLRRERWGQERGAASSGRVRPQTTRRDMAT